MINFASNSQFSSSPEKKWAKDRHIESELLHKPSPLHQEKNLVRLFNAAVEFTNTWDKNKYIATLLSLGAYEEEAQKMANLAESQRNAAKDYKNAELLSKRLKL